MIFFQYRLRCTWFIGIVHRILLLLTKYLKAEQHTDDQSKIQQTRQYTCQHWFVRELDKVMAAQPENGCYHSLSLKAIVCLLGIGPMRAWPNSPALNGWTIRSMFHRKTFFFHLNSVKIGEIVFIYVYQNFTKFHRIRLKIKKVFLIETFIRQSVHY